MTSLDRRKIVLSLVAFLAVPARAVARSWQRLGERRVRLWGDYDVIPVTWLKGEFRAIRLTVRDNGIFIDHISVVYGNGAPDNLPVRAFIPKGGETRRLDLRGYDRVIRAVHLHYRSVPNSRGQAQIQVWGLEG